jgi:hypothetical protein
MGARTADAAERKVGQPEGHVARCSQDLGSDTQAVSYCQHACDLRSKYDQLLWLNGKLLLSL